MRADENRVLVLAPFGQDADAMAALLRGEGVVAEACPGAGECLAGLEAGAGAVLLTEEALELPRAEELLESLRRQPAWSELPLIILTSGGESRFERLLEVAAEVAGGVTLLERPMREGTLLHTVQVALAARRRQYQVRDLLAERERAEAVLRDRESRLRVFFESEMMGAIYWTMDGRITEANTKFLQMVGYTREDLLSGRLNWAQMSPPEYRPQDDHALEELKSKGVDTAYEKEYIRKDGTRIPILIGAAMLDEKGHEGVAFVLDITERRRTQEALRQSEERFKLAMEGSGVGLWDWDIPTGRVYYSPRWKALFGYEEKDIGETVEDWARLLHPEDRTWVCKYQEDFLAGTGKTITAEYRLRHKDGSYRWIEARAVVVRDQKGQACRLVGSHGDITARKEAEAALREREERLRTIMETAQVAILVAHDPECRRVTGNSTAHRLLGVPTDGNLSGTPGAPIGVAWRALSGGRELAGEELPMQRAARTGEIVRDMELEIVRGTGARAAIVATAAPLRDAAGAITGAVGTLLDITERKRAEEALRQAKERLAYHVQNTPLAVVEFDAKLNVCAWGEGAERIFGWQAEEVVGRPMWEIPWICEEDRANVQQVSAALESGQTLRSVSPNRNLRKDGRVIWCEWYNSSLTDPSGKLESILSLVLDVTQRKEAEAVLARDKEQLERLVAERTAELRELVGELEHFSYSITHDMRAPLRAMMGFAEVVKDLCSACGGNEQKIFLERIQTAARRMDLLITDALNYSKAVRSELPLAPMDVGRLLRGMVDTYPELQLPQGSIRIEPELPLVMGNEAGLTQCFSNLLVNAVKFTKPGEAPDIRVWAELLDSQVADLNGQPRQWVRIWVEDRGIGIGPKMLPRVFDMFTRGTSERAGTGIGLALVRKVVQRMGGRVGAESQEGRGSRFWVELTSGEVRRTAWL